MNNNECQSCGYKIRKNSKKPVDKVNIDINLFGNKIVKDMVLCSDCQKDLLCIIDNVINNYSFEYE